MALYRKNSNNELELYDSPWAVELYPVGFIYVQFPGTDDPVTLGLPGTWQNISSSYAGRFFRAEGGQAAAFGCCQDFATQYSCLSFSCISKCVSHNHTVTMACPVTPSSCHTCCSSGGFGVAPRICPQTRCTCTSLCVGIHSHSFSLSNTTETRPTNYTIRIWKRVS